ncbi:phospholipase [Flavobacterium sp. Sd200]|uniref:phospholipase D-like domain-containing protein n=1 Tax=Flavobacterium sp. Sd200 TaxID=2692211 RepID=UPI00136F5125|nr:phospholipase D-like domain-containing protein [Flavobacterium sp. Sd200]MXN92876.1 phospholipase [Flavobacterium sp. Sd200]
METNHFAQVIEVIKSHEELYALPGVFGVRPGFSTVNETLPVIILVLEGDSAAENYPNSLDGWPVETLPASPLELTFGVLPLSAWEGLLPEAAPAIHYKAPDPARVALVEMNVSDINCHVGPDAGWSILKPFLEGAKKTLTVAMYEFYANHIKDTVNGIGDKGDVSLRMILQVDKNDLNAEAMLTKSFGNKLEFVKASVSGPNRIFNNSYHTKVAVRDSESFWLSSGNWSPNSQPEIAPGNEQTLYKLGNREWHVVINDKPLAEMYEKFILYDMEQAKSVQTPEFDPLMPDLLVPEDLLQEAVILQPHPFEPTRFTGKPTKVKPLMSPDNYAVEILKLIEAAEEKIYLQFSYIRQPSTATFDKIIEALSKKMAEGLDVKIIVGTNQDAAHSELLIGTRNWKRAMFHQQSSKLHNKGILIDGKIAVVGSNNWSSDGTQYNRDTSLVFFSEEIAAYYNEVFMFDWNNLTKEISKKNTVTPVIAQENAPVPPGMVKVSWGEWYGD